jgi:hypothetical protein
MSAIEQGDVIEIEGETGQFVATQTELTGGGYGHGSHDVYPDGYQVTAKALMMLGDQWEWDANGRVIRFMQKGQAGSNCYSTERGATIVGRMQMQFVRA